MENLKNTPFPLDKSNQPNPEKTLGRLIKEIQLKNAIEKITKNT